MITDYARVTASWPWACRGQAVINLALSLRGDNMLLVPEITYTPPPAERVGWRATSGTAPARKGGRNDRIRREDRGSHRRRQRHGPRVGPPAGGGSLQCRNVRRLAGRSSGNAKAVPGGGVAAGAARHDAYRRCRRADAGRAVSRRGCRPSPDRQDSLVVQ